MGTSSTGAGQGATGAVVRRATQQAVLAAVLLAAVTAFQMLGLPQPFTGPVVNAVLFLAAWSVGPLFGGAMGFLTPVVALARGQLAAPLAPMVPFIGIGNAILVVTFALLRRVNVAVAMVAAAALKWAFLSLSVQAFVSVPAPVAVAMQWPQLVTALAGGLIAWVAWRGLPAAYRALGERGR